MLMPFIMIFGGFFLISWLMTVEPKRKRNEDEIDQD
jgi:hypothetical protein